ncbi:hypothetical protein P9D43_11605 [Neobacillus niacini]|uniref:hypothetical protein n=1 Tax=Neobacillus niacini TaxID=86668 RepID=UPI00052FB86A|nr:hypothetical protein [Neobacillus niacini]KGM45470.1 hypothetical protein NP83_05825 [Neobacillus niacini]MEC1522659.1 hypothetical protein [Neobacillus niacini]
MLQEEHELLLKRTVEIAPDWLKSDIHDILGKEGKHAGVSYVISQLHDRYSFSFRHILSAINFSDEWTMVSRERLSFIDNNIDVIVALYDDYKGKTGKNL